MSINVQEMFKKAMEKTLADKAANKPPKYGPAMAVTADVAYRALRRIEAPEPMAAAPAAQPTVRANIPLSKHSAVANTGKVAAQRAPAASTGTVGPKRAPAATTGTVPPKTGSTGKLVKNVAGTSTAK